MTLEYLRRVYLKYIVGYDDPHRYWDQRWIMNLKAERESGESLRRDKRLFAGLLKNHKCKSVLEIGCGRAVLRQILPTYLGLDFSQEALTQSGLEAYIVADLTRRIPLPSKSFDAIMSSFVLQHISPRHIKTVVGEIRRVSTKLILLREQAGESTQPHCFKHDFVKLFTDGTLTQTLFLLEPTKRN